MSKGRDYDNQETRIRNVEKELLGPNLNVEFVISSDMGPNQILDLGYSGPDYQINAPNVTELSKNNTDFITNNRISILLNGQELFKDINTFYVSQTSIRIRQHLSQGDIVKVMQTSVSRSSSEELFQPYIQTLLNEINNLKAEGIRAWTPNTQYTNLKSLVVNNNQIWQSDFSTNPLDTIVSGSTFDQTKWQLLSGSSTIGGGSGSGNSIGSGKNIIDSYVSGEVFSSGIPLVLKSPGRVFKANATTLTNSETLIGISSTPSTAPGEPIDVVSLGKFTYSLWNWTAGAIIYLDKIAGGLTETKPILDGDIQLPVGYAISSTEIYITIDFPKLLQTVTTGGGSGNGLTLDGPSIEIYMDATNGNDINTGLSTTSPIKTWDRLWAVLDTKASRARTLNVNLAPGIYNYAKCGDFTLFGKFLGEYGSDKDTGRMGSQLNIISDKTSWTNLIPPTIDMYFASITATDATKLTIDLSLYNSPGVSSNFLIGDTIYLSEINHGSSVPNYQQNGIDIAKKKPFGLWRIKAITPTTIELGVVSDTLDSNSWDLASGSPIADTVPRINDIPRLIEYSSGRVFGFTADSVYNTPNANFQIVPQNIYLITRVQKPDISKAAIISDIYGQNANGSIRMFGANIRFVGITFGKINEHFGSISNMTNIPATASVGTRIEITSNNHGLQPGQSIYLQTKNQPFVIQPNTAADQVDGALIVESVTLNTFVIMNIPIVVSPGTTPGIELQAIQQWSSGSSYKQNNHIIYGGVIYKATVDIVGIAITPNLNSEWITIPATQTVPSGPIALPHPTTVMWYAFDSPYGKSDNSELFNAQGISTLGSIIGNKGKYAYIHGEHSRIEYLNCTFWNTSSWVKEAYLDCEVAYTGFTNIWNFAIRAEIGVFNNTKIQYDMSIIKTMVTKTANSSGIFLANKSYDMSNSSIVGSSMSTGWFFDTINNIVMDSITLDLSNSNIISGHLLCLNTKINAKNSKLSVNFMDILYDDTSVNGIILDNSILVSLYYVSIYASHNSKYNNLLDSGSHLFQVSNSSLKLSILITNIKNTIRLNSSELVMHSFFYRLDNDIVQLDSLLNSYKSTNTELLNLYNTIAAYNSTISFDFQDWGFDNVSIEPIFTSLFGLYLGSRLTISGNIPDYVFNTRPNQIIPSINPGIRQEVQITYADASLVYQNQYDFILPAFGQKDKVGYYIAYDVNGNGATIPTDADITTATNGAYTTIGNGVVVAINAALPALAATIATTVSVQLQPLVVLGVFNSVTAIGATLTIIDGMAGVSSSNMVLGSRPNLSWVYSVNGERPSREEMLTMDTVSSYIGPDLDVNWLTSRKYFMSGNLADIPIVPINNVNII